MGHSSKIIRKIGKCIYCGATNSLTDEHIIPNAFIYKKNEKNILAKASCKKCNTITSNFEGDVLGGYFYGNRVVLNLESSYNRGIKSKTFPLVGIKDGKMVKIDVPIDKNFNSLALLEFEEPAYLTGKQYEKGLVVAKKMKMIQIAGLSIEELGNKYGLTDVRIATRVNNNVFGKFLAKIAYCRTVAIYGLESLEENFVLPIIFGCYDDIGKYIGTATKRELINKENYLLTIRSKILLPSNFLDRKIFVPSVRNLKYAHN